MADLFFNRGFVVPYLEKIYLMGGQEYTGAINKDEVCTLEIPSEEIKYIKLDIKKLFIGWMGFFVYMYRDFNITRTTSVTLDIDQTGAQKYSIFFEDNVGNKSTYQLPVLKEQSNHVLINFSDVPPLSDTGATVNFYSIRKIGIVCHSPVDGQGVKTFTVNQFMLSNGATEDEELGLWKGASQWLVRKKVADSLSTKDWITIRHMGEKALGATPSMSDEEYLQVESEKKNIRDEGNKIEKAIYNFKTLKELFSSGKLTLKGLFDNTESGS